MGKTMTLKYRHGAVLCTCPMHHAPCIMHHAACTAAFAHQFTYIWLLTLCLGRVRGHVLLLELHVEFLLDQCSVVCQLPLTM